MKKVTIMVSLLALVLSMAAPAWADGPGVKVMIAWLGGGNGIGVTYLIGSSKDILTIPTAPVSTPGGLDNIAALEDAYKTNSQNVENALGTFNDDLPVAYSAGLINYMARVGFNPASVGGPNIPPGSVTQAMMPNGYLMIDAPGPDGYVNNAGGNQLNPGETPPALAGAISTPVPQPVGQSTPSSSYVKPQPTDVSTKATPQEVATTSPSVPAPGQGTSPPQKLTPAQQQAAAQHVPENYITNPPDVHIPRAGASSGFLWKWVYIGGVLLIVLVVLTVMIIRRRNQYPVWHK